MEDREQRAISMFYLDILDEVASVHLAPATWNSNQRLKMVHHCMVWKAARPG